MNNDFQVLILFYFFIIFGLCLVVSFRFYEDYCCNHLSLCPCCSILKESNNISNQILSTRNEQCYIEEPKRDCV